MGLSSKQNASCRISQKLWPFHAADLIRPDAAPSGRRHHSRRHRSAGTIPARRLPGGRSAARPWQGGRRSRVPPAPWGRRMSNRRRDIVPPIAGTIPRRANTVPPRHRASGHRAAKNSAAYWRHDIRRHHTRRHHSRRHNARHHSSGHRFRRGRRPGVQACRRSAAVACRRRSPGGGRVRPAVQRPPRMTSGGTPPDSAPPGGCRAETGPAKAGH